MHPEQIRVARAVELICSLVIVVGLIGEEDRLPLPHRRKLKLVELLPHSSIEVGLLQPLSVDGVPQSSEPWCLGTLLHVVYAQVVASTTSVAATRGWGCLLNGALQFAQWFVHCVHDRAVQMWICSAWQHAQPPATASINVRQRNVERDVLAAHKGQLRPPESKCAWKPALVVS